MTSSNSLFCCVLMLGSVVSLPNVDISEGHRLYRGYKVLRAHPQSEQQRAALLQLEDEVDFWSEIGPDSTNVDFLVDPFDQDRILHYLAYFGLDVEILIEDLQQEIDNEDSTSLREVKRLKRQNTLFDLLPFFKSQTRPRRKPQFSGFPVEQQNQQQRFPRKFPSNSGKNTVHTSSSSNPPSPNSPISSFEPQNTTRPGMNMILFNFF